MSRDQKSACRVPCLILSALLIGLAPLFALPSTAQAFTSTFNDVTNDAWYAEYLDFTANEDLFQGDTNGQFNPDQIRHKDSDVYIRIRLRNSSEDTTFESNHVFIQTEKNPR